MSDSLSLTRTVFTNLRDDILSGKYEQGSAITEEKIAQAYNVSRSPVRSAFRQLSDIGLLHIIPNKGVFVEGITLKDMDDVYEIRLRIEGLASSDAAKNATEKDIEELTEIVDLSDFYFAHGNKEKLKSLDGSFHECIFRISQKKILKNILSELISDVSRFRCASMDNDARLNAALSEHRSILNAITSHDPQEAERLTELHIRNAYDNIRRLLANKI